MQNPFQNDAILKKLQNDVALLIFRFYFFSAKISPSDSEFEQPQVPEEENPKQRRGQQDHWAAFEIGNLT